MMVNVLRGQMMDSPLIVSSLVSHAARHFGDTEIVSRTMDGNFHRYTWLDCEKRAKKLASALLSLGVQPSDRIGTLAWNGFRHLEAYFAIPGIGSVCHTINPRLFDDQIIYIINHADDAYVLFDTSFAETVERIADKCPGVRAWVCLSDNEQVPKINATVLCYEELLAAQNDHMDWPQLEDSLASYLCYTSGTTGMPKGVLYSHRSTVLHAYASSLPDALACSAADAILPLVPMFHVNAWGMPHSSALVGAKLVLPGKDLDGASIFEIMDKEGVTLSAGVPTVWLSLLEQMRRVGRKPKALNRAMVGGSACPDALFDALEGEFNVTAIHAWGMTEVSPLGTFAKLTGRHASLSIQEQKVSRKKQGRVIPGIDIKIVGSSGEELPWDGKAYGDLYIRGPWVISSYYNVSTSPLVDGWFPTGDVATIDRFGFMQITDRSKDIIKSGGEWISSIDIENLALSHPAVKEAACIAAKHDKWGERPLLVVVTENDAELGAGEILKFIESKVAKWWVPDDVVVVEKLPHTATGKLQKLQLRSMFGDYLMKEKENTK